jgi:hypothetical protein
MLIILIPTVWVSLIVLFVAVCKMAARGDATPLSFSAEQPAHRVDAGLVIWESAAEVSVRDHRVRSGRAARRRAAVHGIR